MKSKAMWISCILAALLCGRAANAKTIITMDQVGSNVVATGSGTINLTDLHLSRMGSYPPVVDANGGWLFVAYLTLTRSFPGRQALETV